MITNEPIVNDANLLNSLSSKGLSQANKGLIIDRGIMLSNYTQETIDSCWEALSINIIQNYQKGKGTYIKNLGTFTYKAEEINLEGTTNQYIRDKKPKIPVFIVSNENNRNLVAGEYTKQNGIRYYTQKENKDISIVNLNFSQIAYSLSMSKDEVSNLINNLILYIMENISKNNFENKILPGLGIMVTRGNILAVKFYDSFVIKNKFKDNKRIFTKKNILMDMDMNIAQDVMANDCMTPYANIEDLKATNSLITIVEKSAKDYLQNNYNTDIKDFPQHEIKNIYKNFNMNKDCSFKFINDNTNIKSNRSNFIPNKNKENLPLGFLDEDILKSIEYFKGLIIKNCKTFDLIRNGTITKEEAIEALIKTNISDKIDYNIAKNIVDNYTNTENIEYMKFIAQLIKDSRLTLIKKNSKDNLNLKSLDYKFFKRENKFKKINNNLLYKSIGFNNNDKNNLLSTEKKYKLKKSSSSILEEYKKHKKQDNITNIENKTSILNLSYSNSNSLKARFDENFLLSRQKDAQENKKKLKTIIKLLPEIKRKYFISLDQKISSEEFLNILNNYNISYPKENIEDILIFLGISDINSFSINDFEKQVKYCKIITTSLDITELNEIMKKLKDIVYINGKENFFFNNDINLKNTVDCETFVKLFKNKNVLYEDEILKNIFYFLVKNDREFNINDYKTYFENNKNKFDEPFFINMMKKLMSIISQRNLKPSEYFDFLISFNISTKNKVITRLNWIKYLQNEKMKFSAEE